MKTANIVILESSEEFLDELKNYFDGKDEFNVCAVTGSGNAGGGNAGSGNGAVQTGDAAAPAGLLAVLVISGGVVTVLARRKRMR